MLTQKLSSSVIAHVNVGGEIDSKTESISHDSKGEIDSKTQYLGSHLVAPEKKKGRKSLHLGLPPASQAGAKNVLCDLVCADVSASVTKRFTQKHDTNTPRICQFYLQSKYFSFCLNSDKKHFCTTANFMRLTKLGVGQTNNSSTKMYCFLFLGLYQMYIFLDISVKVSKTVYICSTRVFEKRPL